MEKKVIEIDKNMADFLQKACSEYVKEKGMKLKRETVNEVPRAINIIPIKPNANPVQPTFPNCSFSIITAITVVTIGADPINIPAVPAEIVSCPNVAHR